MRDLIANRWEELNPDEQLGIALADDRLVEKHALIAIVLSYPKMQDRRRWPWFLHEGPQAREEAREAA